MNTTIIHIGSDHAGYELKEVLKVFLEKKGYNVIDHGADEYDEDDDYPDFIFPVAQNVALDTDSKGIVLGGSGQGEAIAANRVKGIRAVVFNGQYQPTDGREVPEEIVTARQHNDANVLSLGARFLSEEEAKEAVDLWLETGFSGEERHLRRIKKLDQMGF
ncbi:MAG: RpiB/LacA/LacB family sugar-phosphate isomerase [Bacteriovoracia bacterium]